jgi:hypothetical protein
MRLPAGAVRTSSGAVRQLPLAVLLAGCLAGMPAWPHHTVVAYDHGHTLVLEGTVEQFRWTNPHTWLYVDVPEAGSSREWALEGASVSVMLRSGWSSRAIREGDRIKVLVAPRKDGRPGGQFMSVTLSATGQVLQWGMF